MICVFYYMTGAPEGSPKVVLCGFMVLCRFDSRLLHSKKCIEFHRKKMCHFLLQYFKI